MDSPAPTSPKLEKPKRKRGADINWLTPGQRRALLGWVAEGLTLREINNLAEQYSTPFKLTTQNLYHYRKMLDVDIVALQGEQDVQALRTGLAIRANRVKALCELARMLEDDIKFKNKLWVEHMKGIGSGYNFQAILEEEFNASEVQQLRGVYDDIAREVGGRALVNSVKLPTSKTIVVTIENSEAETENDG